MLGLGAAVSVGPIFVTIVQESATRGFSAGFRVILGSAVADLLLMVPALAFVGVIAAIDGARLWIAIIGAAVLAGFAVQALRDGWRMWTVPTDRKGLKPTRWAFWKGAISNLANPLTWAFWLATGVPALARASDQAGVVGLLVFTAVWLGIAIAVESSVAVAVSATGRRIGPKGQAGLSIASGILFFVFGMVIVIAEVMTTR
ncbi:LysE family translocator [Rhodococcoides fascians]|uniref:LysE family translocator n=1 Tax=Rhodococcoides fascians TaxID=1828 RepID=UPI00138E1773|nr:LysE family transporter [Rhodococcus fascians]